MNRKSNRKWHRVLAYIMALVLVITAVPVASSQAADGVSEEMASKAAAFKEEWVLKGNDEKTTLFVGDSFVSPAIWENFYDTYAGKDVLRAGIPSSMISDWQVFVDDYLAYTYPKNLVVNLGTNDVTGTSANGNVSKTADEIYSGLTTLFNSIHVTLPETNIYYFGITERSVEKWMDTINETNALMETWCDSQSWITYVDTSVITTDDLSDTVHIKPESYYKLVDALAETGIVIEDVSRNIDIYLIAGQSNAAGTSVYDEEALLTLVDNDTRYVDGFEHILYAGTASPSNMTLARSFEVQPVKAGQGSQENMIGPELGMAASLSDTYNSETGAYAGIIKYAVGGTPLLNHQAEEDGTISTGKTWTPPSYEQSLSTSEVTSGTGVLYENFLAEVEEQLQAYKDAGFNPTIRGMYWMQGEADRRRESEYINAFECLVSDVRSDLTDISGQDLSEMPIMVGEISRTFYGTGESTLRANQEFLAMQGMFPTMVEECYLINNSVFDMHDEDGNIIGSDNAHWNYSDCIEIGKLVGEEIKKHGMAETGDVNGDTKIDGTDLGRLRDMLTRTDAVTDYMIAPDVYVNYNEGQVYNDGQDGTIEAEACIFDNKSGPTAFVETEDVTYTTGRNGDVNGAIITNHYTGPYTVVRDYEFGKEDFTVSTWFKVPEDADISVGSTTYLMGIDNPDGTTGFSVSLKAEQLRFRVLSATSFSDITYERNVWYNLVITRDNNVLRVFLDGSLLHTESVPLEYDFGTTDLGVGAYVGLSGAYKNAEMYFDDVQIYDSALNSTVISTILGSGVLVPEKNNVNLDDAFDVKDLVALKKAVAEFEEVIPFDVTTPDAEVTFSSGVVENTGSNATILAGKYELDATSNSTCFVETDTVEYGEGVDGTKNGAIITNNLNGAYTVLNNVQLEQEDFSVSTWFKIPDGQTLGTGNGCYLMGTTKVDDTTNGFRLTIRNDSSGFRFAFRSGTNSQEFYSLTDFTYDEWHHVAVSRIEGALFVYYDGELAGIQIIGEDFDFGDNVAVAFGAHIEETWSYSDINVLYDDVRLYQKSAIVSSIREITTENQEAKVELTFDDSSFENTGTDTSVTVDKCVISSSNDSFESADSVTYTAGRDGSKNSAIITNHQTGPYAVVKEYGFGTDDFTVSAWFNTEDASVMGDNSGFYVFGTNHPDTGKGFSLCIKKLESGQFQMRLRATTQTDNTTTTFDIPDVASSTWYNVTAVKVGELMRIYFDGALIGTYAVNSYDFGTADLAFGAYYGFGSAFHNVNTYFDDIQVYGVGLSANQIQEKIFGLDTPRVRLTFDGGMIINSGTDTSIVTGSYVMDATTSGTAFNTTDSVTYTTGRAGDTNGAIITNHQTGPYAVVKSYPFGTDDFTVSTWFNTEDASALGDNSGFYLFGTNHPDTGKGFSLCIKELSSGQFQLRLRATTQASSTMTTFDIPDVTSDTWYNVTAARVGTELHLYFDGSLVGTYDVYTYDFGTRDLAFGAYYGFGSAFLSVNTYYDDIRVYGEGLSANQIREHVVGLAAPRVKVTFEEGTVANSGTDRTVTAKAYMMDTVPASAKTFTETDTATYTTGRDGSENGAMVINHNSGGPYAVIRDCDLGTGDFTISTWFNTEKTSIIGTGAGGYLFGTTNPNDATGFSVVLKRKAKDTEDYQIRFRGAGLSAQFSGDGTGEASLPSIEAGTWYNVVIARVGSTLNIYFDGEMVLTCSVGTYDFGASDIAFGAQFGLKYNDVNTYYDDIAVYGVGLSGSQVKEMYKKATKDTVSTPSTDDDVVGDDIF